MSLPQIAISHEGIEQMQRQMNDKNVRLQLHRFELSIYLLKLNLVG